jgi:hypothetical protein
MGGVLVRTGGMFDVDASLDIFRRTVVAKMPRPDERFVSLARSLSASMEMFVVGHEAGHIAYGHTLGQQHNYDVSRNQERDADSFASSALSTSPFREYLFLGQVFVTLIFAWVDHAGRSRNPTTHPLGRERFLNAMASNSEAAKEAAEQFGLTRERLEELLPPKAG